MLTRKTSSSWDFSPKFQLVIDAIGWRALKSYFVHLIGKISNDNLTKYIFFPIVFFYPKYQFKYNIKIFQRVYLKKMWNTIFRKFVTELVLLLLLLSAYTTFRISITIWPCIYWLPTAQPTYSLMHIGFVFRKWICPKEQKENITRPSSWSDLTSRQQKVDVKE